MKRVSVIGTTGSGKSTFSKQLANKLDVSYLEMDCLYWKPNWQEPTKEEFVTIIAKAVEADNWVMDGNYSRTTEIKWSRADTVIWLDYSFFTNVSRLIRRSLCRAFDKKELWPDTGNYETFNKLLFSNDSIMLWFFKNFWKNRKRFPKMMDANMYPHLKFYRLESPKQAQDFLNSL